MPGPAPQPSELKRRRGNPGKRALNKREPKPQAGLPGCPSTLSAAARVVWEDLGAKLLSNGVITEMDGEALAGLCVAEVMFQKLSVKDDLDVDEMRMVLNLLKERRAQHAQFGMTPASRSKIAMTSPETVDPIEDALH
jgi:hypothetical protein